MFEKTNTNGFFQNSFDPANLTKEEERLFFGERISESHIPFERYFSPSRQKLENRSQTFIFQNQETFFLQFLLIPYQNRFKSFFDVVMMFLVSYSVFTNLF